MIGNKKDQNWRSLPKEMENKCVQNKDGSPICDARRLRENIPRNSTNPTPLARTGNQLNMSVVFAGLEANQNYGDLPHVHRHRLTKAKTITKISPCCPPPWTGSREGNRSPSSAKTSFATLSAAGTISNSWLPIAGLLQYCGIPQLTTRRQESSSCTWLETGGNW